MLPIDAKSGDLDAVLAILRRYVPNREVWAFGSRVTGAAKNFSDLDLVCVGDEPLPSVAMADLNDAFSESDLPFKVDVVDWATTTPSFRKIIETNHVVLQDGKQNRENDKL